MRDAGERPVSPRSSLKRDSRRRRLLIVGLGAGRRSAVLAEIFVQIPGWEHEQESFPCRGRHSAGRAIEQRGIQRSELVRLFRGSPVLEVELFWGIDRSAKLAWLVYAGDLAYNNSTQLRRQGSKPRVQPRDARLFTMRRWVRSSTGTWERAGSVSKPPVLLAPDRRPLVRSISHRIRSYSMAKGRGHA